MAAVVGASAGIGLAAARRLGAAGLAVVVNGRDQARLDAAAADVASTGVRVRAVPGDAADPATGDRLAAAALALGVPQVLVTCAGGGTTGRTWQTITAADLDQSHRHNLTATLAPIQALAPLFVERGYGRIVTVSSLAGRRFGRVSGPEYSAHKAAVVGLTRAVAAELASSGVTVNCVAPGLIDTPRARRMLAELPGGTGERIVAGTPIQRMGTPDEVAAAIAFLASPDAGFITGHTLDVNGGAFMD